MNKPKKHHGVNRHQARESVIEVLYAWQSGGYDCSGLPATIDDRVQEQERQQQDAAYLRDAVAYITGKHEQIDEALTVLLKRSLRSVAVLELNILRLAYWEMTQRLEIPYRVVINEALELARDYSGEEGRGFVNGVLDRMASSYRQQEFSQAGTKKGA